MRKGYEPLYETGRAIRSKVLGEAYVAKAAQASEQFGSEFQEMTTALAWGGIWAREGLALRDRSLIAISVLAALNRPGELAMHIPGGLRNGLGVQELEEALLHVGLYAGFPATTAANKVAQAVLNTDTETDSSSAPPESQG